MILGISGKARVGKDYVARCLAERFNAMIYSFSDPLYAECMCAHNICVDVSQDMVIVDGLSIHDSSLSKFVDLWMQLSKDYYNVTTINKDGFECLYGYRMKYKDPLMLQWWGTEFRRDTCSKQYWIDLMRSKLDASLMDVDSRFIIIPDTRFINEAQFIQGYPDGHLIRIEGAPREDSGRDDSHASETELDNYGYFDYTFINKYDYSIVDQIVSLYFENIP